MLEEGLTILGLSQAAYSAFLPVLESFGKDLANDIAKDASKSYIAEAFSGVSTVIHKKPLSRATGRALKELLELVENELLDTGYSECDLSSMESHVKGFIGHPQIKSCLEPLFLDPGFQLDPACLEEAWCQPGDAPVLDGDFSWQRISRRFTRKVRDIRNDSKDELKETFDALQSARDSEALQELAGLPPEFDLDRYREALIERFGNLNMDSLDTQGAYYNAVRLWNIFVPQSARECLEYRPQLLEIPKEHQQRLLDQGEVDARELELLERDKNSQRQAYYEQPVSSVLDICEDPSQLFKVILGDPGSGKSTLLQYMALKWAQTENPNTRYSAQLPVLIELRDYNRWECSGGKSFPDYLHQASTWHRLNRQTLAFLLKQPGRVLLLLDGLDEVFDPAERELVINDIHRFSNDYPETQIILTSRVVGYKAQRLRDAGFKDFMLQDLDEQQVEQFLSSWHQLTFADPVDAERKRARLGKAITNAKSIRMLAGNPLLLTMMAIINRYQELPRDRVMLYEKAAELLLQQWDTERQLRNFPGLSSEIDLRAKTAILRKVAFHMQTGSEGNAANIIQGETLIQLIEKYLRDELGFTQVRVVAKALVDQLRDRNFILCFVGADSYAFVHRTFLEYFCAAEYVYRFQSARSIELEELAGLFDRYCHDDDWHEVLKLICGQIDALHVEKLVIHLAQRSKWRGGFDLRKVRELTFAMECLAEVKSTSRFEVAGQHLAEQLIAYFSLNLDAGEIGYTWDFILKPAVTDLGVRWPNKDYLYSKVESYLNDSFYAVSAHPPAELFVAVAPDRPSVERLAVSEVASVCCVGLEALSSRWPDQITRDLLQRHYDNSESKNVRMVAVSAIAKHWQDDRTRALLELVIEKESDDEIRATAIRLITDCWQDEQVNQQLRKVAVSDPGRLSRESALAHLIKYWKCNETFALVAERAVGDVAPQVRSAALSGVSEHWQCDQTRNLLTVRARSDENYLPRETALHQLAHLWGDDEARQLLIERAVVDEDEDVRYEAGLMLSNLWPDEQTCELLASCIQMDVSELVRFTAIEELMGHWGPEVVLDLIRDRAAFDGAAAAKFAEQHSDFGGHLFSVDADGIAPFFNPADPISDRHIEKVAGMLGIKDAQLTKAVAELSVYLGWDITQGSGQHGRLVVEA